MKIIGYGEDALTLWALQHRLETILSHFGDRSDLARVLVLFRPSFGRRGSSPVASGGTADSSQFGEFDTIIGSPKGVYLIEAKSPGSRGAKGGTVQLGKKQVFRHKVFQAYLKKWRDQ